MERKEREVMLRVVLETLEVLLLPAEQQVDLLLQGELRECPTS